MSITSYENIIKLRHNLAASQLTVFDIPNKNVCAIRDLLDRDLRYSDNGSEVGSANYVSKSMCYFIRAKALQREFFLPFWDTESFIPVRPQVFIDQLLKKGDILISKDSNIGESILLDKDYPNYMMSGALYKLPISKNKYYLFAFLKHDYFRKQLDLLVPKGSTIRHAKTSFLDCKIPFPGQKNKMEIIKYVEILTEAIYEKEIEIRRKNDVIFRLIEEELYNNQKNKKFNYRNPRFEDIKKTGRMDAGIYVEDFKRNSFLVENYKYGSQNIIDRGYKWARGTSLEIKGIGTRVDSEIFREGFYELVIPANISEYGTILKSSYIGTPKRLKTIKEGDIIFGGEGFKKGRSFVVCNDVNNIATNYHGIRLFRTKNDLQDSIFVRCFLAFWREKGMIDYIGVGGSGGHCAPKYFHFIETPLFPEEKKMEISKYYHLKSKNPPRNLTLTDFLIEDKKWNNSSGIIEID
ncbi:MAG: restriction endonuclease subunit S, partial [Clostridiales Family XIII bacterium]|nr:restriction endonuclease subunit S [Clostridiales Family XIII bacterium]